MTYHSEELFWDVEFVLIFIDKEADLKDLKLKSKLQKKLDPLEINPLFSDKRKFKIKIFHEIFECELLINSLFIFSFEKEICQERKRDPFHFHNLESVLFNLFSYSKGFWVRKCSNLFFNKFALNSRYAWKLCFLHHHFIFYVLR